MGSFKSGDVHWVADDKIVLPGQSKAAHETRPVVIVSDQNGATGKNADEMWPSVLVVPISSSTQSRTKFCVKIAAGEGGLNKKGWARVPAIQLMDKRLLRNKAGSLSRQRVDEITAKLLEYMGLIES